MTDSLPLAEIARAYDASRAVPIDSTRYRHGSFEAQAPRVLAFLAALGVTDPQSTPSTVFRDVLIQMTTLDRVYAAIRAEWRCEHDDPHAQADCPWQGHGEDLVRVIATEFDDTIRGRIAR